MELIEGRSHYCSALSTIVLDQMLNNLVQLNKNRTALLRLQALVEESSYSHKHANKLHNLLKELLQEMENQNPDRPKLRMQSHLEYSKLNTYPPLSFVDY